MKEYIGFSEWRQDTEFRDPAQALSGMKLNKWGRPVMTNHKARANNRHKRETKAWPIYLTELHAFLANGNKLDHYEVKELSYQIMSMDRREKAEIFLASQGWKRKENGKWFDPNHT